MANYQTQYDTTPQDTDEYGNPIQQGTTGGFGSATTGTEYGTTETPYTGEQQQQERGTGMTGSGYGTTDAPYTGGQQQQERGMMDKIKDKIPGTGGGRRDDDPYSSNAQTGTGMTGTGYGTTDAPCTGGEYEERGMMDKVKAKISGTGQRDETYSSQTTSTTTPYGGTTGEHQEKKGVMDKIKEKLPGGRH
uniref:Dehydrin 6 n=1 Tax=Eriobotrya japonica TaxID=32224 RepID=T2C5C3_9ROSA|nr:dehydrin 6 [Eriobotrya japonica]